MTTGPRRTPCPTCPYRRDVPSGVWAPSEYDKLEGYDGETWEQAEAGAIGVFFCHQRTGEVCAGWAGTHDMDKNLALRIGARTLDLDVAAIRAYKSPVPLFASGHEAAEHGRRDIEEPGEAALAAADKLTRLRQRRAARERKGSS